jgi:hypothetical protein
MELEAIIAVFAVSFVVVGVFSWLMFRRSSSSGEGTLLPNLPTITLVFIAGPRSGQRIEVNGHQVKIGRGPDCEIRVDDPLVSWEHALLSYQGSNYILYDLNSTNGTWVNNQRVAQCAVRLGQDQIRIGPLVFVLYEPGSGSFLPQPDPPEEPEFRSVQPLVNRLKEYQMLETLGRGASVVYKARDKHSGQVVAIKILTKPDAYIRNKFENEMRVLPKRLAGHPHIVQVYGGD